MFSNQASIILCVVLTASLCNAHSTDETLGPLRYFELVSDAQIDRYDYRQQGEKELLRLRFKAHSRHFCIHLKPTSTLHNLVMPKIMIDHKPVNDPSLLTIQAYHGDMYNPQDSESIVANLDRAAPSGYIPPSGWARLTAADHQTDDSLLSDFDGTIFDGSEMFTIISVGKYRLHRRPIDVGVKETIEDHRLMIYKNADRQVSPLHKRSLSSSNNNNNNSSAAEESTFCGTPYSPLTDFPRLRYKSQPAVEFEQTSSSISLFKRSAGIFPPGCPQDLKVLYMGVAADCSYTTVYGGSAGALRQIISDWNQASKIYQTSFNIMLAIHSVDILTQCDSGTSETPWNQRCSSSYTISQRLSDFSYWRGKLNGGDPNGLWVLMTQCSSGTTIGISWLNMVCINSYFTQQSINGATTYVSGTSVVSAGPNEWIVVAHEIGHSFGANHDCTAGLCAACPGPNCQCCKCQQGCDCQGMHIMNPTSDVATDTFSQCSISTICQKISTLGSCLKTPGSMTTISGNTCGNGIKEYGEDCDCGPANGTECRRNSCCDGSICRYRMGAICDDSTDSCCASCKFKPSGTVCKEADGPCLLRATCSGQSGGCPSTTFVEDTTSCLIDNSTSGQCASGHCTSRDLQCQMRGNGGDIIGQCQQFSDQCAMYCATNSRSCMQVSGYFIDGTVCGYGGRCLNGACATSTLGTIIGWIRRNQTLAIILGVAIGLLILSCLWELMRYIFCPAPKKSRDELHPIGRAQSMLASGGGSAARPTTFTAPQSPQVITANANRPQTYHTTAAAPDQQQMSREPNQRLVLHFN